MKDEDNKKKLEDKSAGELILYILYLLGKMALTFLRYCFVLIVKGIIFCIEKCIDGWNRFVVFWNSTDTRIKRKKLIDLCKRSAKTFASWCVISWRATKKYTVIGAKQAWKYTVLGCKLFVKYSIITALGIWAGILWTLRTITDLIIHSKPTFIRLGKSIKQGSIDFWHWLVRVYRGIRLRRIRRKRAWQHFRRTKGFKGLLVDMGKGISNGIKSFMEEEQTETAPEAITEDDIIVEELEEHQSSSQTIGKKIFKGMKEIVEEK